MILHINFSFFLFLSLVPTIAFASIKKANDRENAALFEVIINGTVDDLDDAVEAAGGYNNYLKKGSSLLYYATAHQKLVIFKHLIGKGFSVDAVIPRLGMPIYRFIITMKSNPVRDRMLRIAYETSDRMFDDYYKPMFKKTGWDADAAEAMKVNDFIYIDRILNRHKAHPDNVITNQGLMIHSAILNDCPECVKLILEAGGNPNHPFVGNARLSATPLGKGSKTIDNWSPLMMAVAMGNMRVIEALLASPKIQVCKGLPGMEMHTARDLVRNWTDLGLKCEVLKKLQARPADTPILENWIKGIALEHLTMKFALSKKNRKLVEFLLHNCINEIDYEWVRYAAKHSNSECLEILAAEYPETIDVDDCISLLASDDPDYQKKLAILQRLQDDNPT